MKIKREKTVAVPGFQAHWSGMMSGLKDVADEGQFIPGEHEEWIEYGAKNYLSAIKIAPSLME